MFWTADGSFVAFATPPSLAAYRHSCCGRYYRSSMDRILVLFGRSGR
jgi:hypothetical protein